MSFYIAIDFDGTIAEHRFPEIGPEVRGAFEWIKKFKEKGAILILLTMRDNDLERNGPLLDLAIEFCRKNGVEFDFINENPQKWSKSRKVYANQYIDDNNANCPLIQPMWGKPYVDWSVIGPAVLKRMEFSKI